MQAQKGEVPSSFAFLRSVLVKPGKVGFSLCFAFIRREDSSYSVVPVLGQFYFQLLIM